MIPERTTARVARLVDSDADRVGGARVLADRPEPQPDRRPEHDEVRATISDDEQEPDHQVQVADRLVPEAWAPYEWGGMWSRKWSFTSGMFGIPARGVPFVAVDLDEEVAGDAEGEEVDRRPADDLVGAHVDREERVDQSEDGAGASPAVTSPSSQELSLSAPRMPKKQPESIMPSSPMFTTPAALGEHAADRRERERRREDEHEVDHLAPVDDAGPSCSRFAPSR